jgi:hypothetical protein
LRDCAGPARMRNPPIAGEKDGDDRRKLHLREPSKMTVNCRLTRDEDEVSHYRSSPLLIASKTTSALTHHTVCLLLPFAVAARYRTVQKYGRYERPVECEPEEKIVAIQYQNTDDATANYVYVNVFWASRTANECSHSTRSTGESVVHRE